MKFYTSLASRRGKGANPIAGSRPANPGSAAADGGGEALTFQYYLTGGPVTTFKPAEVPE